MRLSIIFLLVMMLACQTQKKNMDQTEKAAAISQSTKSGRISQQENVQCNEEICLQFRNHDTSKKSFEIYMLNSVPIAGFQCDLSGINITDSNGGGLLQENGYQTLIAENTLIKFDFKVKQF